MLTEEEAKKVLRLTEAVFPGAAQAKVDRFIQRDTKSNSFLVEVYRKGLLQLDLRAMGKYRLTLLQLNSDQLNQLLEEEESTSFFKFLREHTIEGMFSDPIYGGNDQAYGWRMIGFAGPRYYDPESVQTAVHPKIYYSSEGVAYEEET